jgi:hypothetical protein
MSRLDDVLVAALQDKADDAAQSVDTARARAAVEARLDRVDQRRRRRLWLVPVAVGAVAAATLVLVIAGRGLHEAAPLPPAHPSPTSTWLTLSPDPFMVAPDAGALAGLARDPNSQAQPMNPCLLDPGGWGAVQVESAAYRSPTDPSLAANEYVLRFADPAAAHRAIEDAWAHLQACPTHFVDLGPPGLNPNTPFLKDIVAGETNATPDFYVPRIGRAGNVVVVLEGTGEVDDRSYAVLDSAMTLASPQYAAFGPKTWP